MLALSELCVQYPLWLLLLLFVVVVVVVVVVVAVTTAAVAVDMQHYYWSLYMSARMKHYDVFNEQKTPFQKLLP